MRRKERPMTKLEILNALDDNDALSPLEVGTSDEEEEEEVEEEVEEKVEEESVEVLVQDADIETRSSSIPRAMCQRLDRTPSPVSSQETAPVITITPPPPR